MKINKEDIPSLLELLKEAEELRSVIRLVIDLLKSFSSEFAELPEAISRWMVKNRIKSINQYVMAGFSESDAILMTLDDSQRLIKLQEKLQVELSKSRS